jgi:general secretion pathway protein B
MSYILEALRKSEQERQATSARGVGMLLPPTATYRPVQRRGLILGVVLAMLAVLAGLWWLSPAAPAKPSALAASPAVAAPATPPPAAPAQVAVAPPVTPPPAAPAPLAVAPTASTPTAVLAPPVRSVAPAPAKKTPAPSANPPAAAAPLADSAETGKGLPAIRISGFIDDEQGKLAIINDKLVREGEEVAPGLRLEEIVDDKAVFSFKGQRFRR